MLREVLNTVPLTLLLVAAVGFSLGAVLLTVFLVRRTVPATREGFHDDFKTGALGQFF